MTSPLLNRSLFLRISDGLAVAVAISLPWSTSLSGILIALWALALLPTLDVPTLRRTAGIPGAATPVLLFALAVVGMAWSEARFDEQLANIKPYLRLLAFPLLLIQFQRSDRGPWVVAGYLISCSVLLVLSWIQFVVPQISFDVCRPDGLCRPAGVPAKDYIIQSSEFLICAFALAHLTLSHWVSGRYRHAVLFGLLGFVFLVNIVFVATGRSTLVIFLVLVLVFAYQRFQSTGMIAMVLAGIILAAGAWASSPYLRGRVLGAFEEIRQYQTEDAATSAGYRLEFWKKSAGIFSEAPVLGHGTGSTEEMFRRAAVGKTGTAATVTDNPHNQILIVAIQLGLIGVMLLAAMWAAHLLLFLDAGLVGYLGLGIVVQNIAAGFFNSYLFEFTLGWTYVFGAGVLGGMVLRAKFGNSSGCDDLTPIQK